MLVSNAPVPIPYQGSKRLLAPQILAWMPTKIGGRLIEPFAGSAAITLAVSMDARADYFVISDILQPLAGIWELILNDPNGIADGYELMWNTQLDDPRRYYDHIRDEFNVDQSPIKLLYLLARCVKNAVRFNDEGRFNQSPDNRRLGMNPVRMRRAINSANKLLSGRTEIYSTDYTDVLNMADTNDLVYMDPPYQGVNKHSSKRYLKGLDLNRYIIELDKLNNRNISYLVSFDGQCGDRNYGIDLPNELGLKRVLLPAGRSSQATLLGRDERTVESLYVSPSLITRLNETGLGKVKELYVSGVQLSLCM